VSTSAPGGTGLGATPSPADDQVADHDLAILYQVPFVLLVPEALQPLVCRLFSPVRYQFGDVIVREGDPPDGLYVLTTGSARALTEQDAGEVTLGKLLPGTTFGEAALISGGPRTATVRASERCHALRLSREAFDAVVSLHPEVSRALSAHLEMQTVSRVLRTDPVFSLLPMGLLAEHLGAFSLVEVAEGDVLVHQGGPGDAVYVVASGRFVVRAGDGPAAVDIGYVRAGDVVGERAAVSGLPRSATVVATTPGRVVRLAAATFRLLLAESPRFAAAVEARGEARDRRGADQVPLDFAGDSVAGAHAEPPPTDMGPPPPAAGGKRARFRRFPVVRQFDSADCAVAALASVARFHGRAVSATYLRDVAATSAEGTSLRGICAAGRAIGLEMTPLKVSQQHLGSLALPAIAHWEGRHWVVLYRLDGDRAVIGDPASGLRQVPRSELFEAWDGFAATARPTPALAQAPTDQASLRWVLPFLRPYLKYLVAAFVLALVAAGFEASVPVLVGRMVDRLGTHPGRQHRALAPLGALLAAAVAGTVVMAFAQRRTLSRVTGKFDVATLDYVTGRLLNLPMSYFAKRKAGDIERRLQSMADIRRIVVQEGIDALTALSLVLVVVAIMFSQAPLLAVAFTAVLPLYGLLMWLSHQRVRPVLATMEEALGRYTGSQVDLLKGVETVKTLGAEPTLRATLRNEFAVLANRVSTAHRATAVWDAGVQGLTLGSYTLFVVLGAVAVSAGSISLGTYVAFIGLVLFLSSPFARLMLIWDDLQATSVLLGRLNDVLASEPEQGSDHSALKPVTSLQGRIQLRGVDFAYRDGDQPVLSGIDLEIEPATTVAIVGRSGSGKSTLLRVIGGLVENTAGTVTVDSVDVRTLRRRELRERIGYVLQAPYVFSATIAQNIAFGQAELDMDKVRAAAEAADFADIAQALPLQYETRVGDGALRLSGGEAQRLSIARALYRQPPVLLLDEATSSLDSEAELAFHRSLARLSAGRTVVLVTHRLRSVRDADVIVVVEKGRIVERGSHDDLIRAEGIYAYLYRLQYSDDH
jgi:ATP-binding cassette subfamily B protein